MNNSCTLDITNLDIDLEVDKEARFLKLLRNNDISNYNGKVKVNNTVIEVKFAETSEITSKSILKLFNNSMDI